MWKPEQLQSTGAIAGGLALVLVLLAPAAAGANPAETNQLQVPTTLDPCQLVTSSEASSLAGVNYATGLGSTNPGGSATCVYGAQTLNVFMVTVAQATDPPTAQADWSQEETDAQSVMQRSLPSGVSVDLTLNDVSDLPGFDQAALAQANENLAGRSLNISAIYLLKGATFVTFSDLVLDQPAPTKDALESESQTVLPRLP